MDVVEIFERTDNKTLDLRRGFSSPPGALGTIAASANWRAHAERGEEPARFGRREAFGEHPMPELDSEPQGFRPASESFAPVPKLARLVGRGLVREIGTGPQQDPRRRDFLAERPPQ